MERKYALQESLMACGLSVALLVVPSGSSMAHAQTANAKGKLSRNFYRVPYDDGIPVFITRDYVDHGNTPAGNTGPMDMVGTGGAPYVLVAAADGQVTMVNDAGDDCGCHGDYSPCANVIRILHANGEQSNYLHIQKNSAMVVQDQFVQQGDPVAIEGDVGWTCGNGRDPVADICVPAVPDGAGKCGPHLHWDLFRVSTGEFVNPIVCGEGVFTDGGTFTGAACDATTFCVGTQNRSGETYSGFGQFQVLQSNATITASTVTVSNFASVVYHAEDKVRLLPGFKAGANNAYFRAEIGLCNQTAPSP